MRTRVIICLLSAIDFQVVVVVGIVGVAPGGRSNLFDALIDSIIGSIHRRANEILYVNSPEAYYFLKYRADFGRGGGLGAKIVRDELSCKNMKLTPHSEGYVFLFTSSTDIILII